MSKTLIFTDSANIAIESAGPLADAANIQALLNLIGEVQTPTGMPTPKTGIDLVKDLMTRFDGIEYLNQIMVVTENPEALRKALAAVRLNSQKQTMNLDLFSIDEAGNVYPISEAEIIERNSYYVENDTQATYVEKVNALSTVWNDLQTWLKANKIESFLSDLGYSNTPRHRNSFNGDRFIYSGDPDYPTLTPDLRIVNELK